MLLIINGIRDFNGQEAIEVMTRYGVFKLLILWIVALPLIYLFAKKRYKTSSFNKYPYILRKDSGHSLGKAVVIGAGYALFAIILQGTVLSIIQKTPLSFSSLLPIGIFDGLSGLEIFINMLIFAVVVPIGEEYLFRGVVFRETKRLFRPATAIILSAIPFTLAHIGGVNIFHAGFLGILLSILYYYTGDIRFPIIAHITNNILAQLVQTNQALYWIVLTISAICFILGIKYLKDIVKSKPDPAFDRLND